MFLCRDAEAIADVGDSPARCANEERTNLTRILCGDCWMNRTVLTGIAAFALLIGAGLALTESSAQAGHGCGGGLFSGHHRGGACGGACGGGGLFSRLHANRGCAGARGCAGVERSHHARSGCGGGLLARLRARHNSCAAPAPTCCAPAPAPVACCPAPAPAADCCPSTGTGYAQPACDACVGGEVIMDSGAVQGGQAGAPPAPPQEDGGQQHGGQQDAPDAPPAPQPEAEQTEA